MVKFKFPGRPSKIVQRNLVSAYSVVLPTCDTSSITEDVCYGLSVFRSSFGDDDDDEESEPFRGFDDDNIEKALARKRKLERDLKYKMISRGLCIPVIPLTRVELKNNEVVESPLIAKSAYIDRKSIDPVKPKERKKSNKIWLLNKRILNRYHPKLQFRHNFKTLNKNSLMRFKHKSLSANYLSDRYCRKFVLPSRSLRSSRVIKPNKRFLDHDRRNNSEKKSHIYDFEDANSSESDSREYENNRITEAPSKVIIREARLNITTETTITGPFSAKKFVSVDKESRSGVITCGICGSARFYKYVLETRKFGIYSCEPCRQFILKIIKYSKQPQCEILKCRAQDGKCVILPVVSNRSNKHGDNSVSKNTRCEACLLSLCLQKYVIPASIKKLLTQLIPEEVKLNYLNSVSPDLKKSSLPILDNYSLHGLYGPVSNVDSHDKFKKRLNVYNYLRNARCLKKTEAKFLHKRNTSRQKANFKSKPVDENPCKNISEKEPYLSKGPRIKHVCRSASSVLKTSSTSDKEVDDPPCNLSEADCFRNSRKSGEIKMNDKGNQISKIRQCDEFIPKHVECSMEMENNDSIELHYGARTLQDFNKYSSDESEENEDKLISTDFWEAYDPDEVFKTGFPLISSESLNVRALCFLCGSAGIEKLLYCVSCCEPYHWYCAEGPSAFREESELEKCRVNWVCRKCKVCSTCGERDSKTLISCQRCKNSFHTECLTSKATNKRLFKSDRPWVCPACLKCKSCNSNLVFTYVGNIPLCSQCFKLRQKGSFCPLCQRCYQDDDYNVKMMECGICMKWIHAKCEGISHEKYQILSFLPDTIEFVCRLCCTAPPTQWWLAVEDELKAGFLGILKCLCKNKKINDLFKESPRKDMCRCLKEKKTIIGLPYDSDSSLKQNSEIETTSSDSSLCADKLNSDVDDLFSKSFGKDKSNFVELCSFCCYNSEIRNKINQELLSIKAKVHNNQYNTLAGFHQELESVISDVKDIELMRIYKDSLKKFFPWFDPHCIENDNRDETLVELSSENCSLVIDPAELNVATEEEYCKLRELMAGDEYSYENFKMLDVRKCNLCKGLGEAVPSEGGRLIYCGRNEWVHSNCALWSSEVFEEIDGSLQNIHSAISRGRQIRCNVCDKKGASVGCCFKNCTQTYHFQCAKKACCVFLQNRTIFCQSHDTRATTLPILNCEKDFEIFRPVYIEMDRKKKRMDCHANVRLRIGSLHVENLGKIDPHLSDNPKYIIPIYFRCTRLFWSVTKPWKIIQYHVQIKLKYSYEPVKVNSEVNFTVDHTVNDLENDEDVARVVNELVNKICSREDYYFSSTQNGNDLLSPDLQEAIYRDLPNDLLNDKLLQDIWNNYDGMNEVDCAADKSGNAKKVSCSKEHKTDRNKKSKTEVNNPTKVNGRKASNEKATKVNGKYLRDKNDFKDAKQNRLDGFYNELRNKVIRKIDFENSTLAAKKKLYDGNYITNEFYQEAERNFKSPYVQSYENILQLDGMVDVIDEEPVKCIRCHRTYRTTLGFDRHLEICNSDSSDYMISSCESDSSEEEKFNPSCAKVSPPKEDECNGYVGNAYQVEKPAGGQTYSSADVCNNVIQNGALYSFSAVQENVHTANHQIQNVNMETYVQNIKQETIAMAGQPDVSETFKFNLVNDKIKSEVICDNYGNQQFAVNNVAQTQSFQIQNMTPTYVIQQFPKPEIIPTYVSVENTINECIQADSLLQQPLQLQQIATVNQPSVNFQPMIPTILGTIVQPSVIETPTYIVNTPNTELFAPQGNIILPNQPVLFGMETTVMSSSQFMTQSLTGNVGSSTMYSTTTTQVFQAAKQLPQQNFSPGFIVVNSPIQQPLPQQQPTQQTIPKPQPAVNEKYMYVQLNTQHVKPAENRPKPVITKTQKKHVISYDKPMKVIRVKNNKPVFVPNPVKTNPNYYSCRVNGGVKHVPNGRYDIGGGLSNNVTTGKIDASVNTTPCLGNPTPIKRPLPSPTYMNKFNTSNVSCESVIKRQKVDKCINTDRKDLLHLNNVTKTSTTTNTTSSGDQTIQLKYSLGSSDTEPKPTLKSWQITLPAEEKKVSSQFPSLVKPIPVNVETPPIPPLDQPNPKVESSSSMPSLDEYVSTPIESSTERVRPVKNPSMKTDSEKIFDELLRQHFQSMENNVVTPPEPPQPSFTPKIYSKHKYQPKISNAKRVPSQETENAKDTKFTFKKNASPEKENNSNNSKSITETENTKNWKTASISFEVNAEDGFSYKSNNLKDLWNTIIDSVQKSRAKNKIPLLPKNAVVSAESVYSLLGFENNASKYLLEQLPDAWKCIFYKPVFHKSAVQNNKATPLKNETGCARTEPVNSSHKHDMFGWLASRHRKPPKFMMISDSDFVNGNRRVTSLNLPMAMRFRYLKETAKETVGVFRSDIHGRGLFCLRDIDPGEMVIEYAGEVIRSTLTDKREKYYTSKGIGCYMFRIDDKYVVDATMCGNAARFINHSCEPNCYSRIVDILGKKHILIFALRKIPKGEELTYDYKFPLEDDKIYCHCLSRKCRKYLN